jgi:hypothetical protein
MTRYEVGDLARELEHLTHNMNEYFRNQSDFERTRNRAYIYLATQNLRDADMTYGRLAAITLASSRK